MSKTNVAPLIIFLLLFLFSLCGGWKLRPLASTKKDAIVKFLKITAATATSILLPLTSEAASSPQPPRSVVVIGGNGKTGRIVLEELKSRGIPAIATSYNKTLTQGTTGTRDRNSSLVYLDITNASSIAPVINDALGVICCASASYKGGTATAVDFQGCDDLLVFILFISYHFIPSPFILHT